MVDKEVSWGCNRFGIMFMTDNVSKDIQDKINDKADEIFWAAQKELDKYIASLGLQWEMGVVGVFKGSESHG